MRPNKINETVFSSVNTDDAESKGAGWLVTFGDSMSLLLTFFVLLISFSSFDTLEVSDTMVSMSKFLGGGAKAGDDRLRANFGKAKDSLDMTKKLLGVELSELPIPIEVNEPVIDLQITDAQKLNTVKKMLKNNPALLKILIEKKSQREVKEIETEEKKASGKDLFDRFGTAEVQLSLENLQHYVISEGLSKLVNITHKTNGDISFEVACNALFDEDSAEIQEESKLFLVRIAKILTKIPNKIAIENYGDRAFEWGDNFEEKWRLPIARSESIINFFIKTEQEIPIDRFSIYARGYVEERWGDVKIVDTEGEGMIGINILAYSEADM